MTKLLIMSKIFRKIRILLRKKTSRDMIDSLKEHGVKVGENTFFFAPMQTTIDIQRPWLIEIGDYCKITQGVVILAHDYSRSVIRKAYGDIIGEAGKTIIGNNVFIGVNSIILMGSHIGNNVIVGAGSVVHGDIPDNVVCAGNPARVICTLDEYYRKRKCRYIEEAKLCAREFYKATGRKPLPENLGAFFPLYMKRNIENLKKNNIMIHMNGDDNYNLIKCFMESDPIYASFDDFLKETIGE